MEINKFEEIDRIREAWKQAIDSSVIKAATENWTEYPPHVQAIIESEAKNRGLWEKVLYLRGEAIKEPISEEGNLKGYVCEGCKGTYLNFETGRCMKCDLPSDSMGYCIKCDKFWPLAPGQLCPEHGVKLSKHKAAMALLRLGNDIFDMLLFQVFVFVIALVFGICLVISGLVPDFFQNVDRIFEWPIGIFLYFLYMCIFETTWQRSPAKFITGTKVVTENGTKPSFGTIVKRTLIRLIPFEPFSFLGERVYGWHDKWSGTYVIKAKRFKKKKIDYNQVVICPQPISVVKTPEKSVEILSVSHRKVEICENCGRTIGKLEQAYVFLNHIVCQQCHEKLKKQI